MFWKNKPKKKGYTRQILAGIDEKDDFKAIHQYLLIETQMMCDGGRANSQILVLRFIIERLVSIIKEQRKDWEDDAQV